MANARWRGHWCWVHWHLYLGAVLFAFIAAPAANANRLEFSAQAKITSTVPAKGWDIWQSQQIEFNCNWSVKVGHGFWKSDGSDVSVSAYAFRAVESWKPHHSNLEFIEHALGAEKYSLDSNILAVKQGVVPAGTHGTGKGFAGQWKVSFKPDEPGNWIAGCYATAPKAYKVYEIDKPCNGSTYAWCAVAWDSIYVSKPLPFDGAEIPEPEILSPVKAPGDEVVVLSADVNGVSLSARISTVSVTREKTKATRAPCGVLLHSSGYTEDALPCPPMYFWVWASDYTNVFNERWHLQLLKRQGNGAFKQLQTFSGVVNQQTFERTVSRALFNADQDGGDIWRLKAWLTQENTPSGTISGKVSAVDFEVQFKGESMPTVVQPSTFPPILQPGKRVKHLRKPGGAINFEGESLVNIGRGTASSADVVAQPMSAFGENWSGDAQLFWRSASAGAILNLTVDVQTAGMYSVEIFATKAPDYGDMMMNANGQGSGAVAQGYAPNVVAPTAINMGNFNFKAGANTISLTVVGKSPQSSGFFIGVDRILLHPIDR